MTDSTWFRFNSVAPAHIKPPPNLELKTSNVSPEFLGVFCLTTRIEKGVVFGPYTGKIVSKRKYNSTDFRFAWEVYDLKTLKPVHILDANDPLFANWMRYVCCARYFEEQNIVSTQLGLEVYYRVIKDIEPGEELLTWFQPKRSKEKKDILRNLSRTEEEEEEAKTAEKVNGTSDEDRTATLGQKNRESSSPTSSSSDKRLAAKTSEKEASVASINKSKSLHQRGVKEAEDLAKGKCPEKKKNLGKRASIGKNDSIDECQTQTENPEVRKSPSKAKSPEKLKRKRKPKIFPDAYVEEPTLKRGKSLLEDDLFEALQPGQKRRRRKKMTSESVSSTAGSPTESPTKPSVAESVDVLAPRSEKIGKEALREVNDKVDWEYPVPGTEYVFEIMREHVVWKCGKRVFKCDICYGLYRHTFSLKRHYLRNHINYHFLSRSDISNCLINLSHFVMSVKNKSASDENGGDNNEEEEDEVFEAKKAKVDNNGNADSELEDQTNSPVGDTEETDEGKQSRLEEVQGTDNREADNKNTDIHDTDIKYTGVKVTDVKDADLKVMDMVDTDVKVTDVKDTDVKVTDVKDTDVKDTCMKDTDMKDSDMKDTDIKDADMKDMDVMDTDMKDTDLKDKDLKVTDVKVTDVKDDKQDTGDENADVQDTADQQDEPDAAVISVEEIEEDEKDENFDKNLPCSVKGLYGTHVFKISDSGTDDKTDVGLTGKDRNTKKGLFRCNICHKLFDTVAEIRSHTQFHPKSSTGSMVFECDLCIMRFSYKHNLERHRAVHKQDGEAEDPHKCKAPSRSSPSEAGCAGKNGGGDKHGDNKKFQCARCRKIFANLQKLVKHQVVHKSETDRLDFSCQYCGKDFPTIANMKKHVRFHLGYRISCRYCTEVYPNVGALRKHIRLVHPDIYKAKQMDKIARDGVLRRPDKKTLDEDFSNSKEKTDKPSVKVGDLSGIKQEPLEDNDNTVDMSSEKYRYDNEMSFAAEEIDDGGSRFKFSCTICKKRFSNYINMCRHRRRAHSNEAKQRTDENSNKVTAAKSSPPKLPPIVETPEMVALFYANVSNNVATNLSSYIDGKPENIGNSAESVKVEAGPSQPLDEAVSVEGAALYGVTWNKYNFPPDYRPGKTISFREIRKEFGIPSDFDVNNGLDISDRQDEDKCKDEKGDHGREMLEDKVVDSTPVLMDEEKKSEVIKQEENSTTPSSEKEQSTCPSFSGISQGQSKGDNSDHAIQDEENEGDQSCTSEVNNTEKDPDQNCPVPDENEESSVALELRSQDCSENLDASVDLEEVKDIKGEDDESPVKTYLKEITRQVSLEEGEIRVDEGNVYCYSSNASERAHLEGEICSTDPISSDVNKGRCQVSCKCESSGECTNQDPSLLNTLSLNQSEGQDGSDVKKTEGSLREIKPDFSDEPNKSPSHYYNRIAFGLHGKVTSVCAICRKHFRDFECLIRHHWKKHPSSVCNYIEVEQGHEIDSLYYSEPSNIGALAVTDWGLESSYDRELFTCTRCMSTFKSVARLHLHIVNCAPIDLASGQAKADKKPKSPLKKKLKKGKEGLNSGQHIRLKGKDFDLAAETLPKEVVQSQKRIFMGCRKRKSVILPDSPIKHLPKRSHYVGYNPQKHVRRRELTEVLDTHQCEGCGHKLKSISLLERHVKKCKNKEKFKDLRPMQCSVMEESLAKLKHKCFYCKKSFTYMKSLMNHLQDFCPVKRERLERNELTDDDKKLEEKLMEAMKLQEEEKVRLLEEAKEGNGEGKRRAGWPRGLKRKNRKKGHAWTSIKRKKSTGPEQLDASDLMDGETLAHEEMEEAEEDEEEEFEDVEMGPTADTKEDDNVIETPDKERQREIKDIEDESEGQSELRKYLVGNIGESSEKMLPKSASICTEGANKPQDSPPRPDQKKDMKGVSPKSEGETEEETESLLKVALLEKEPRILARKCETESPEVNVIPPETVEVSVDADKVTKKSSKVKVTDATNSTESPNKQIINVQPNVSEGAEESRKSENVSSTKEKPCAKLSAAESPKKSHVKELNHEAKITLEDKKPRKRKAANDTEEMPSATSPFKTVSAALKEIANVSGAVSSANISSKVVPEHCDTTSLEMKNTAKKRKQENEEFVPPSEDTGPVKNIKAAVKRKSPKSPVKTDKRKSQPVEGQSSSMNVSAIPVVEEDSEHLLMKDTKTETKTESVKLSVKDAKMSPGQPEKVLNQATKKEEPLTARQVKAKLFQDVPTEQDKASLKNVSLQMNSPRKGLNNKQSPKKLRSQETVKSPVKKNSNVNSTADNDMTSRSTIESQRKKKIAAAHSAKVETSSANKESGRAGLKSPKVREMMRKRSVADSDVSKLKIEKTVDHDYSKGKKSPAKSRSGKIQDLKDTKETPAASRGLSVNLKGDKNTPKRKDGFDETHKLLNALESPEPVTEAFSFPKAVTRKSAKEGKVSKVVTPKKSSRRRVKASREKSIRDDDNNASDISR